MQFPLKAFLKLLITLSVLSSAAADKGLRPFQHVFSCDFAAAVGWL